MSPPEEHFHLAEKSSTVDPLYVVELKVAVASGAALEPERIYDRLVDHACRWLSRDTEDADLDLTESGRAELPARRGVFEFMRSVRWTVTETKRVRALHCRMRQPIEDGHGAQFLCDFTLYQDGSEATIRVELGRESVDGLMSPVAVQFIRRPGVLASVVRDPELHLTYQGQVVTGRYEWINPPQAALVPVVLAVEKRLPILLIDGGSEHAKALGQAVANQLSGLAQVLLVDRKAQALIASYLGSIGAPLPENGARLVWPVLGARHPQFWDLSRTEKILGTLMKIVAGVSVAARGTNRLRTLAADEARREREAAFQEALAEATVKGDASKEIDMLRNRVVELDAELTQWVEEVDRLTKEVESTDGIRRQLAYWKSEAQRAYQTSIAAHGYWDSVPQLKVDDLSELAKYLEEVTEGAITFTIGAHRSWAKCDYPHVDAMEGALIALAQAATEWRKVECNTGMRMKEWLKTRFGLNYSHEDEPLVIKKLNMFEHDGNLYSRESHLKLDDHVKPNEVGRVYFAQDTDEARFIVDHVGLKLYGI